MLRGSLHPVRLGITLLAGMFLLGQESWPPSAPCVDLDGDGCGRPSSYACPYPYLDCDDSDPGISPAQEEICDNGKDDDCDATADGDDTDCLPPFPPSPKVVFVTTGLFSGGFGGLARADALCRAEAQAASLAGTFKAWLSDTYDAPGARFIKQGTPYQLPDGTVIAVDWNDLTDGVLAHPIDLDAHGNPLPGVMHPWTNTLPHGVPDNAYGAPFFDSCFDWARDKGEFTGGVGSTGSTDSHWTDFSHHSCFFRNPLICFEQ